MLFENNSYGTLKPKCLILIRTFRNFYFADDMARCYGDLQIGHKKQAA